MNKREFLLCHGYISLYNLCWVTKICLLIHNTVKNSCEYLSASHLLFLGLYWWKWWNTVLQQSSVNYPLLYCYKTQTANAAAILHRKQQRTSECNRDALRIMRWENCHHHKLKLSCLANLHVSILSSRSPDWISLPLDLFWYACELKLKTLCIFHRCES